MAAKKWNISALWAMHEASYKTDPDADGSDYKHIKTIGPTFQPTADVLERPGQINDLVRQDHVIGVKGGKISFKMEMKASGTAAGSATAAIASESSPILESVFGSVTRGTGRLTTTGSTTSAIEIATGGGSSYVVGMMVEIAGEQRFVASLAGDQLTLDRPLSGAPAGGVVVYASSMFRRANSGHKSLAFVAKRDGIEYTFLGCKVTSFKFEGINAKGTPLLSVEVDVGTWSVTTKSSLPATDLTGVTAVKAPVVKGSPVAIGGVLQTVHGIDLDPGHEFAFQDSTEDADGKAGIELVNAGPRGAVKGYYASAHLTDFAAGTASSLAFTCGDRTNGFGFFTKIQWGQPQLTDKDGMVGEELPFFAVDNATLYELYVCQF